MKIIKRSGSEVTFDISKIMAAVAKANKEVVHSERLSDEQIETISDNVESICQEMNRSLNVEEIQDLVEDQIMGMQAFSVARKLRKRAAQHTPNGYRHRLSQALRPVTGRQYGAALGPFPIALQSVRLCA